MINYFQNIPATFLSIQNHVFLTVLCQRWCNFVCWFCFFQVCVLDLRKWHMSREPWTDYECVHSQNDWLSLPVFHTAVVLSDAMANDYTQTPLPHAIVMRLRQTYNRSVWTHALLSEYQEESLLSTKLLDTSHKPKHQEFSCFLLFILCTRFIKLFVLCWCVHIAYVSL